MTFLLLQNYDGMEKTVIKFDLLTVLDITGVNYHMKNKLIQGDPTRLSIVICV